MNAYSFLILFLKDSWLISGVFQKFLGLVGKV